MHVVVDAGSNIPSPLFRNIAVRTTVAAAILVWAAMSSAGAQDGPSTADVPTRFPEAFALWKEILPYAVPLEDWLAKLEGTASPLRDISLDGAQLKFGTVCVPHNCGGNIAGILFMPSQDRVVAMVKLSGSNGAPTTMLIGQMTRPEASCLERLLEDNQLARC